MGNAIKRATKRYLNHLISSFHMSQLFKNMEILKTILLTKVYLFLLGLSLGSNGRFYANTLGTVEKSSALSHSQDIKKRISDDNSIAKKWIDPRHEINTLPGKWIDPSRKENLVLSKWIDPSRKKVTLLSKWVDPSKRGHVNDNKRTDNSKEISIMSSKWMNPPKRTISPSRKWIDPTRERKRISRHPEKKKTLYRKWTDPFIPPY